MNLMYITALDVLDKEKCGIYGKISGQINAMKKDNINVHFGHFYGEDRFMIELNEQNFILQSRGKNTRAKFSYIYDKLFDYIKKKSIKIVYIRFTSLDKNAINFYRSLKNNGITVIIEFYSHNLELEAQKTVKRLLKNKDYLKAFKDEVSLCINKYYFRKLDTCIDLIVTTTKVGKLYNVPTINVINGIDTSSTTIRKKQTNEYDFNIISVAMISSWHGYDRIIKGIANYYKNGGKLNILYNVIGDGEEKVKLESIVKKLGLEKHVSFPGIKIGKELEEYYSIADVALEMLAGFRRTQGQISSIKMAEYFAKGIPIIFSSEENLYSSEINKYCYRVPYDNTDISIEKIINFSIGLQKKENNIENSMHDIAEREFDWAVTMEELLKYILQKDS